MEKKKVTRKFKSGGLHEKHVVAIDNSNSNRSNSEMCRRLKLFFSNLILNFFNFQVKFLSVSFLFICVSFHLFCFVFTLINPADDVKH